MPKQKISRGKGFLLTLIILVIAVILTLGYFGISVQRDVVGNATVQSNFVYVSDQIKALWDTYLKDLAIRLWHWTVVYITNLPVGSGNGIEIPQITMPGIINTLQSTDPLNTAPPATQ